MKDEPKGLARVLNNYSGLWTLFLVMLVVILFALNIQSDLVAQGKQMKNIEELQNAQLKIMQQIHESLKDKDRDHISFEKQLDLNNRRMLETVRIMDRLSLTLDNIDKKLK